MFFIITILGFSEFLWASILNKAAMHARAVQGQCATAALQKVTKAMLLDYAVRHPADLWRPW
jgi:hypothetical protein